MENKNPFWITFFSTVLKACFSFLERAFLEMRLFNKKHKSSRADYRMTKIVVKCDFKLRKKMELFVLLRSMFVILFIYFEEMKYIKEFFYNL